MAERVSSYTGAHVVLDSERANVTVLPEVDIRACQYGDIVSIRPEAQQARDEGDLPQMPLCTISVSASDTDRERLYLRRTDVKQHLATLCPGHRQSHEMERLLCRVRTREVDCIVPLYGRSLTATTSCVLSSPGGGVLIEQDAKVRRVVDSLRVVSRLVRRHLQLDDGRKSARDTSRLKSCTRTHARASIDRSGVRYSARPCPYQSIIPPLRFSLARRR